MTTSRAVSNEDFLDVVHSFNCTAFRLELQLSYAEPEEDDLYSSFLQGRPGDPLQIPELRDWFTNVETHVRAGKRIERVRVHNDPPTDYQRFERWLDPWNKAAGERIHYLSRVQAHEAGLLPAAGTTDWWLLDSSRLLMMRFDDHGRRIGNELTTDPLLVVQACAWRDLAVHHSTRRIAPGVAA